MAVQEGPSDLQAVPDNRVAARPEVDARQHREYERWPGIDLGEVGVVDHARDLTGDLNPSPVRVEGDDIWAAGQKAERQPQRLQGRGTLAE